MEAERFPVVKKLLTDVSLPLSVSFFFFFFFYCRIHPTNLSSVFQSLDKVVFIRLFISIYGASKQKDHEFIYFKTIFIFVLIFLFVLIKIIKYDDSI